MTAEKNSTVMANVCVCVCVCVCVKRYLLRLVPGWVTAMLDRGKPDKRYKRWQRWDERRHHSYLRIPVAEIYIPGSVT